MFVLFWSSYLQVVAIFTSIPSYSLLFHWTSTAPSSWTSLSTLLSHLSTFHTTPNYKLPGPTYSTCLHSRAVCFWTFMQDLDWPWSLQPPESSLRGEVVLVVLKQQQAPSLKGDLSAGTPPLGLHKNVFVLSYKKFPYKIYRYFYNL